jgi:hypothetical protein
MLTGDRPWTHAKTVRYLDLQQFQDAWKEEFDGWKFDFAVALDYFEFVRRPSKVADWLTTRREVFIDYFNFPGLYPYFENDVLEVPDVPQSLRPGNVRVLPWSRPTNREGLDSGGLLPTTPTLTP